MAFGVLSFKTSSNFTTTEETEEFLRKKNIINISTTSVTKCKFIGIENLFKQIFQFHN